MARIEGIVHTLFAFAEPAQPSVLPQGMELLAATGKQLMRIRLVAGIPHDLVLRGIQQIVERHRQFDDTEVRGEVPPDIGNSVDDLFPKFLA